MPGVSGDERFRARIRVTLKPGIHDPQGVVVERSLTSLDFPVSGVRVGKYVELEVSGSEVEARARVEAMCRDLLANPVIERYEFELEPLR